MKNGIRDISGRVGFELHRLDHIMSKNLERKVQAEGIDEITLMHGWIIRYLYDHRNVDVFQKDIEKDFSIGRSTVTNIIQIMEKKGYIVRESVEHDARLKKVMLSPKGVESCEKTEELIVKLNKSMVQGISEKELGFFLETIEKIKNNIETAMKEGDLQ